MTASELEELAATKNLNPYWLAWELCGKPTMNVTDETMQFVFWNNDQWAITRKRLGAPRDYYVKPEHHLETLAATVTAHQETA